MVHYPYSIVDSDDHILFKVRKPKPAIIKKLSEKWGKGIDETVKGWLRRGCFGLRGGRWKRSGTMVGMRTARRSRRRRREIRKMLWR